MDRHEAAQLLKRKIQLNQQLEGKSWWQARKLRRGQRLAARLALSGEDQASASWSERQQFHQQQLETYELIDKFVDLPWVDATTTSYNGRSVFGNEAEFITVQTKPVPMGELDDGTPIFAQFSRTHFNEHRYYSTLAGIAPSDHSLWVDINPDNYRVTLSARVGEGSDPIEFARFDSWQLFYSRGATNDPRGGNAMSRAQAHTKDFEDIADIIEMCHTATSVAA